MSKLDESSPERRGWGIDLSPIRDNPAYGRMWISGVTAGIGAQLTVVAVGVQVYHLTGSTLAVSMVGILALGPMIVVGVFGSSLVDAFDRRTVVLWATLASWLCGVGIAGLAWMGNENLVPLYVLTTLSSVSSTLVGTARFAIHPRLVPVHQLPAAAALSGVSAGLQATVGPALAGLLIASVGFAWTYTVDVLLFATGFFGLLTLPPIRPEGQRISLGPSSVVEGFRVLASSAALRVPILLNLVCMVFGRPQVLYPALAATVFGGGPLVVGLLSSSGAIGVLASSALSGRIVRIRRHGVAVGLSGVAFGASLLALGVVIGMTSTRTAGIATGPLVLACVLLLLSGAADNVANIFRTTMLQSVAPDAVRGRIQGLTVVVLTAGPRAGDAFVGTLSVVAGLWAAPAIGGAVIMLVLASTTRWAREFRDYVAVAGGDHEPE